MFPRRCPSHRHSLRRSGFTLIEAALVTVIISFGVMAMLQLIGTGTRMNSNGAEQTTAMNLARNIREIALSLGVADPNNPTHWGPESGETLATYNDIDDLDGFSSSPPIDVRRKTISNMDNWGQSVKVETVNPDRLTITAPNGSLPAVRVTVTINHNGKPVYTMSWVAFDAL